MKFIESINSGLLKAEEARKAVEEVTGIFQEINLELKNFPSAELKLCKGVSAASNIRNVIDSITTLANKVNPEYFDADRILIQIKRPQDEKHSTIDVATWRQSIRGYPCIIGFEGEEYTCFNANELSQTFKELFSSAGFGKKLDEALNGQG